MPELNLNSNIVSLFKEAEKLHREEFQTGIIEDPEWPLWFAEHMKKKLESILNRHFTIGELVYLLTSAETSHKKNSPGNDWAAFCADYLVQKIK